MSTQTQTAQAVQTHAMAATTSPSSSSSPSPPDDTIPPLSYNVITTEDAQREALILVADSIAQQRQTASLSVIFHPACFAGLAIACTLAYQRNAESLGTAVTVLSGIFVTYLAAIRLFTGQYIHIAENFKWKTWLTDPATGSQDIVIAARFGEQLIATLVLRVQRAERASKKNGQVAKPGGGLIRAWTTRLRFRNKGVGADMLRFAVMTTRETCGPDASIAFDPAHANSALPLHRFFNRPFAKRDRRAVAALEHAVRDCDGGSGGFKA